MREIITITETKIGEEDINSVDARELWVFLESKQQFSDWIKNRVEKYEFVENIDYLTIHKKMGRQILIEYTISIDMAKELAMVENNDKGRSARKYFIQCEKKLKEVILLKDTPEELMARALLVAQETLDKKNDHILRLETKVIEDKPMVEFAKAVEGTNKTISIGALAKISGLIGRNTLFNKLRDNKILIPFGRERNKPYQRFIDRGYFEVSETIVKRTAGDQITFTTSVTGKGQTFLMKEIKEWTK